VSFQTAVISLFTSCHLQKLATKYGVRGIPSFILLDGETGEVRDASARETVAAANGDVEKAKASWGVN
jgi:hypothetical protein